MFEIVSNYVIASIVCVRGVVHREAGSVSKRHRKPFLSYWLADQDVCMRCIDFRK